MELYAEIEIENQIHPQFACILQCLASMVIRHAIMFSTCKVIHCCVC